MITNMNIKLVVTLFFITICSSQEKLSLEMTAREKAILKSMEHRVSIPRGTVDKKGLRSKIKCSYLLSLTEWHELGSKGFIQAMSKHVQAFEFILTFQKFMEDKTPKNPPIKVITNEDGSWYQVQYFHNDYYSYVMSEHSCLPGKVIIEEFLTRTMVTLERHEVYPQMILGDE